MVVCPGTFPSQRQKTGQVPLAQVLPQAMSALFALRLMVPWAAIGHERSLRALETSIPRCRITRCVTVAQMQGYATSWRCKTKPLCNALHRPNLHNGLWRMILRRRSRPIPLTFAAIPPCAACRGNADQRALSTDGRSRLGFCQPIAFVNRV